ncbi:transcriptional protein swt1-like [Plakobranchus ocellatus]|uniref:Transcriptional protein swt1-like n=1 Tax=Plakobranchus ocellatus TaxID=259542 RepID=A0AAV4B2X7_9GAST|nr:transcriptional protein swt1-like [Plakobranchus ocellatus]
MSLDLPPNWICLESKSRKGRKYFYNTKTGASVWTIPKDVEPAESQSSKCLPSNRKRQKEKTTDEDSFSQLKQVTITSSSKATKQTATTQVSKMQAPMQKACVISSGAKNTSTSPKNHQIPEQQSVTSKITSDQEVNGSETQQVFHSESDIANKRSILKAHRKTNTAVNNETGPVSEISSRRQTRSKSYLNLSQKPKNKNSLLLSSSKAVNEPFLSGDNLGKPVINAVNPSSSSCVSTIDDSGFVQTQENEKAKAVKKRKRKRKKTSSGAEPNICSNISNVSSDTTKRQAVNESQSKWNLSKETGSLKLLNLVSGNLLNTTGSGSEKLSSTIHTFATSSSASEDASATLCHSSNTAQSNPESSTLLKDTDAHQPKPAAVTSENTALLATQTVPVVTETLKNTDSGAVTEMKSLINSFLTKSYNIAMAKAADDSDEPMFTDYPKVQIKPDAIPPPVNATNINLLLGCDSVVVSSDSEDECRPKKVQITRAKKVSAKNKLSVSRRTKARSRLAKKRLNVPTLIQDRLNVPALAQDHLNVPTLTQDHSNVPTLAQDHLNIPTLTQDHSNVPILIEDQSDVPILTQDYLDVPRLTPGLHSDKPSAKDTVHSTVEREILNESNTSSSSPFHFQDNDVDLDSSIDLGYSIAEASSVIEDMDVDSEWMGSTIHMLVFVIDTNVLIDSLKFLDRLLNCCIPGYGKPTFVLPWVVIQELDHLKNAKKNLFKQSTAAVRFIHNHLMAKNPHVKGQTPQEANEKTDLPIEMNDDKILHCCLQCQKKFPDALLCLMTRDVNLRNKATIMGIDATDDDNLWSFLEIPNPLKASPFKKKFYAKLIQSKGNQRRRKKSNGGKSPLLKDNVGSILPTNICCTETQDKVPKDDLLSESSKAVLSKFESVWKVVFDVKNQLSEVLSQGKSSPHFDEAVKVLKTVSPLLSDLHSAFDSCLALSPVVLKDHPGQFAKLCSALNLFFDQSGIANPDPSSSVGVDSMMDFFKETKNRVLLMSGLDQMGSFNTGFLNMLNTVS